MLNFFAAINDLGYGVFSYNLIRAYDEYISQDIALFPIPVSPEFVDASVQRWLSNGERFKKTDPSIMIFQAPWLNRFTGNPAIGFPIFELDILPHYDLQILKTLDVILQASLWGEKVLENHGFKNVYLVPGGYDPKSFHPDLTLNQKLDRIQHQGVSFVHVGKWEPRKSSEEILRCFLRASNGGNARANLLFHVYNSFDPEWFVKVQKVLVEYGFNQSGAHFIRGLTRVLVPQERFAGGLKKLYQMAEFGLWASKAEGWNLPLIECIACGRPSLTTNNTAQRDFLKDGVYPNELILTSCQKEPTHVHGKWWSLDEEELTEKIKAMIQNPEKYLKMEKLCLDSVKDFTWENSARQLEKILTNEIIGSFT